MNPWNLLNKYTQSDILNLALEEHHQTNINKIYEYDYGTPDNYFAECIWHKYVNKFNVICWNKQYSTWIFEYHYKQMTLQEFLKEVTESNIWIEENLH